MTAGPIIFFLCLNDRGGAEFSMLRVAEGLRASGMDIRVVAYGAAIRRDWNFGGDLVDLNARRTATACAKLARWLRRNPAACIVTALTHTNLAALAAAPRRVPVIVSEHSSDSMALLARPLLGFLVRRLYARAAAIVAVSEPLAAAWRRMTGLPVTVLYNPVLDQDQLAASGPTHPWLDRKTVPVLIAAGRMKPEKDFATLLAGFALARQRRDLRLILVGDGPSRQSLETLVRQHDIARDVVLPGFVPDPARWMARADLFVSTSIREGFGNVIVEALGQGTPVVATDCPYGPADILEGGQYGTLVPCGDAGALADAILSALDAPRDAERLRARAARFSVARSIEGWAGLVRRHAV